MKTVGDIIKEIDKINKAISALDDLWNDTPFEGARGNIDNAMRQLMDYRTLLSSLPISEEVGLREYQWDSSKRRSSGKG